MNLSKPSTDQIALLTRMARDLPPDDIAHQLFVIQDQGPHTAGAAVLRRAIAEILGLRMLARKMRNGETA